MSANSTTASGKWTRVLRRKIVKEQFLIPSSTVGALIGKGGQNIRDIEFDHPTVTISISKPGTLDNNDQRCVTVSQVVDAEHDAEECVAACQAAVSACKSVLSTRRSGRGNQKTQPKIRYAYHSRISIALRGSNHQRNRDSQLAPVLRHFDEPRCAKVVEGATLPQNCWKQNFPALPRQTSNVVVGDAKEKLSRANTPTGGSSRNCGHWGA